jgi:hypothetical protein
MTDSDLDTLYRKNIDISHEAALRGVWDAGYNYGLSQSATATDASQTATTSTATADTPTVSTP